MNDTSILGSDFDLSVLTQGYEYFLPGNTIYLPIIYNDLVIRILDFTYLAHQDDWVSQPHRHPWYSLVYTVTGSAYATIGDEEFLVRPESFIVIPPGVTHNHRHNNEGNKGFHIRFTLEKIETLPDVLPVADDIMHTLENYYQQSYDYPYDALKSELLSQPEIMFPGLFISWFIKACNIIKPFSKKDKRILANAHKADIVEKIDLFINNFYAGDLIAGDLTYSLNYSYRHLSRIYKEATGITISEKVNQIRMNKAIELLSETKLSLQMVSERVGFHSYANFFKTFSAYTGCSPSEYRQKIK